MKLQDYIKKHGNVEVEEKQLNELLGIKESKIWKPTKNEYYWYIMSAGCVNSNKWLDTIENEDHFLFGNVFKTKEEAEFAVEKRKIEVELQRFAIEHNEGEINWKNSNQGKKSIIFSHDYDEFGVRTNFGVQRSNTVYFTSEDIAKQAIQAIGEDRLKKYYFGVED